MLAAMHDLILSLDQFNPFLALVIGLPAGLLLGYFAHKIYRKGIKRGAESEAAEIIQEAKDAAELRLLDEKEKYQEMEEDAWNKVEKDFLKIEDHIEELEEIAKENKQKLDNLYSQARQKYLSHETEVVAGETVIQTKENQLANKRNQLKEIKTKLVSSITERLNLSQEETIQQLVEEFINDANKRAQNYIQTTEEETKEHSETKAKYILSIVLERFARAYSAERGIAPVYFENPEQRRILVDANGDNLKTLTEITGCDIIVADDMDLVGVAGYDPVRRELTRRILERILKEKRPVNVDFIKRVGENHKRELLGQIKRDGDNLAKELNLHNLHPEIRQMMGSLRFRYSFTQNQYFHCGEVGWLAGVLASELRAAAPAKARRAGMLHDLGKAMDHELDGGHAVIGADFIEKRGEAKDVVHAVRAHHYDEQPSTDMAFLVIAADAISGARPGARRSTIESYNQKVTELEAIARSFEGVTDCYILSGGRECRVITNGRQVDDTKALKLSVDIAKRIESECNYPGQIKVVVVRSTLAVETTKAHA